MCTGLEPLIGGAILQGMSQYNQAQEAEETARYNRAVGERRAQDIEAKTEFDLAQQAKNMEIFRGRQIVAGASSSGDISNYRDVFDMTEEQAELDAQALMYGGRRRANYARIGGQDVYNQQMGQSRNLRAKAGSSLLTGAITGIQYYKGLDSITPKKNKGY